MGPSAVCFYTGCLLATQVRPHIWERLLLSLRSKSGGIHTLSQLKSGPAGGRPVHDMPWQQGKRSGGFRVSQITEKGFKVNHFGIQYLVTRINTGQVMVEKVVGNVPGFQKQDQRSGKAERARAQLATQIPLKVYGALARLTKITSNQKDMDRPVAAMQLM